MAARDGGTSRGLNERLVEPIDSAEALSTPLPPVTERYFERYYAVGVCLRVGRRRNVLCTFSIVVYRKFIDFIYNLNLYYYIDVKGREGEDQCVLQHSNK